MAVGSGPDSLRPCRLLFSGDVINHQGITMSDIKPTGFDDRVRPMLSRALGNLERAQDVKRLGAGIHQGKLPFSTVTVEKAVCVNDCTSSQFSTMVGKFAVQKIDGRPVVPTVVRTIQIPVPQNDSGLEIAVPLVTPNNFHVLAIF